MLVFATEDDSYEIYLSGAGWPGAFTGYMTPHIRSQCDGTSRELPWNEAEELAIKLGRLLADGSIENGSEVPAEACIQALVKGRRYGICP